MARCDARFFRGLARKNGIVPSLFKRAAPTDSARAEAASETETSDTMFEAFYKTAMSVRELSWPRTAKPAGSPNDKKTLDRPISDRNRTNSTPFPNLQRSSVYVAIVIAGALVGEKVVNNGFDSMWESRNKGKLFKHMTFPEPETEE
jgi:ubiquinol-cytochrome c reductase subunit 9